MGIVVQDQSFEKGQNMKHPLVNPSLAPYGFVFPRYKSRLAYKPLGNDVHFINSEKVILQLWSATNSSIAPRPLPVATILHEILPAQKTIHRIRAKSGDFYFEDLAYTSRDIAVLSTVVQWFGTNCGYCFLTYNDPTALNDARYHAEREFLLKYEKEKQRNGDRHMQMWTHVCDKGCKEF